MVKAYFGYKFETTVGAVTNNGGLIIDDLAYSICDQYVLIINTKTQTRTEIVDKNTKISRIAILDSTLAIGYQDGEIIIYNLIDQEIQCRFYNHQSEITQLLFLSETVLISGSCDTSIIVWDLADQSLQFRLTGHSNAITGLEILTLEDQQLAITQQFIVSGSKDGLVKIWDLNIESSVVTLSSMHSEVTCLSIYDSNILICTNSDEVIIKKCQLQGGKITTEDDGILKRQSFIRPLQCAFLQQKFFILNNEKKIEFYKLKTGKKTTTNLGTQLIYSTVITYNNKINSFTTQENNNKLNIVLFTPDNQIVYKHIVNDTVSDGQVIQQVSGQIKSLQLTQNDTKLVVLALNKCYVFDNETNQQISHLSNGNAANYTSLCILPKNKYYLLGDEKGIVYLIDMNQNEVIFEQKIHNSNVNSISYHDNCKAFNGLVIMTTEVDKKVNFVELFYNKQNSSLEFQVVNTIHLKEGIRKAQFSHDGQYYAFAQLNNIISIYYCDSHKQFLELYGHSLPVLAFDFTTDDTMLISGGADKSIKLWATDFGNCKKTLKSHTAEVVQIKTVTDTHYFFSGCKGNIIKYWDGDTYQLILQFNDALSSVSALVVGCIGDLFYTGSKTGVIRKYTQTKEQVFVSEEEEKRLQDQLMSELQNKNKQLTTFDHGTDQVAKDLTLVQIGQQRLYETEQLMDILEKIKLYREEQDLGETPNEDQFNNKNVTEYLFDYLQASDLNSLMRFLHHQHLTTLMNEMNQDIALKLYPLTVNRLISYIYNKVDGFGLNSHEMMMKIINIRTQLQSSFKKAKKTVGYNLDILNLMLQDISKNQDEFIFE